MKRISKTVYQTDKGRELLTLADDKASVLVCGCTAAELDELAIACSAAAEELRSRPIPDAGKLLEAVVG